jgi:integrase
MPSVLPIPKLCCHKASGQGYVTLNGKEHYLGRYDAPETKAKYEALVARWLAHGRTLPNPESGLTVNDVLLAFDVHAEGYYKPSNGKISTELECIRDALRIVKRLHGRTPAAGFGPKKLKQVRQQMLAKGWCRTYVNHQIDRVRRCFRWAVEEELLPGEVYHALQAVRGIRRGMPEVRENEPVKPVPDARVEATKRFLPAPIRAMVELQVLTGMRPGEVCIMRGCDLETGGSVWVYWPPQHKTEHHGKQREVYLGPKAQEVLRPWLKLDLQAYLFCPAESEAARSVERRRNRKTPLWPSHARRQARERKIRRRRAPGDRYDVAGYRRAINRACDQAFPLPEHLGRRREPGGEVGKPVRVAGPPDGGGEVAGACLAAGTRLAPAPTAPQRGHHAASRIRHRAGPDRPGPLDRIHHGDIRRDRPAAGRRGDRQDRLTVRYLEDSRRRLRGRPKERTVSAPAAAFLFETARREAGMAKRARRAGSQTQLPPTATPEESLGVGLRLPTIPREQLVRLSDTIHELAVTYYAAQNGARQPARLNLDPKKVAGKYCNDALHLVQDVKQQIAACRTSLADPGIQSASPEAAPLMAALDEIDACCQPGGNETAAARLDRLRRHGERLRNAVETVPHGPLLQALENAGEEKEGRLVINLDTNSITLDGVPYPDLDHAAVRIVKHLYEAGKYVSSNELSEAVPGCRGGDKPVRARIKKLPEAIRNLLKGRRGSGRIIQLPPKKGRN